MTITLYIFGAVVTFLIYVVLYKLFHTKSDDSFEAFLYSVGGAVLWPILWAMMAFVLIGLLLFSLWHFMITCDCHNHGEHQ